MSESYYHYERRMYGQPPGSRVTYAVQRILLITAAVFAFQLLLDIPFGGRGSGIPGGDLAGWLSFRPDLFLHGALWQPLSYMLLHGGLLHLALNLLTLYWFGPDVERVLSTRQFFRFYVACGAGGVLAELVRWLLFPGHTMPVVAGASGATMGVLAAYAMAYPDREAFLLPFPFPVNIRVLVGIVVGINLMYALDPGSSVSWLTHFGGLGVGYAYMKLTPAIREWVRSWTHKKPAPKGGLDALAEAVDNIFRFEDEKRRRR